VDVNRVAYWVLFIGMILSEILLISSLILSTLLNLKSLAIILAFFGVGILIATPYTRVLAISLVSFMNRDHKLLLISLFVFVTMMVSLISGLVFNIVPHG